MEEQLRPYDEKKDGVNQEPRDTARAAELPASVYVLLGYLLWFGFYLGALIMHALHK